jgi:hypothetical protein
LGTLEWQHAVWSCAKGEALKTISGLVGSILTSGETDQANAVGVV